MRVLLKISGEALQGDKGHGIDPHFLEKLAGEIKEIHDKKIEIAIVLG
jgi:uridylate kinase